MTTKPNWTRGTCIGKGSFGTVNLAVDKSDGTLFAVKSVEQNSGLYSDALENEIRILKSLSSNYIVEYRDDDVTAENSTVYRNLHLEYMPRGTIADMDKICMDDVTVRSYTRCMTSALSYIHSRNIIHCDIKGKNVLIGSDPGVVKLADFGSAVEIGAPGLGTRGSPLWMAPEVVRGEYQGPESDVWSLGCTVIEMVTGKPAWQDRGIDTLFQIGYSDEVPNLPAQISDELRDFISKCLKRHRLERWSCDQLLQHPFLLSCSSQSQFVDKKWSPRCVFDWFDSNFSDDSISDIEVSHVNLNSNSSYARQRICKLCSHSGADWESDGWEMVRNAAVLTSATEPSDSEFVEEDFSISQEEMAVAWPEYSRSVGDATIGRSEMTNREYGDSNVSFDNDDECTSNHAEGTSSCWNSGDRDNNYSCVFVSLMFNMHSSDIFIMEFWFCLMMDQFQFLILFEVIILKKFSMISSRSSSKRYYLLTTNFIVQKKIDLRTFFYNKDL